MTAINVVASAGHRVPDALLEKLLAMPHLTCFGAAAVIDKEIMEFSVKASETNLQSINALQDEAEKTELLLYFAYSEQPLHNDDFQPFVAIDDGDHNPILVMSLEGDFENHRPDGAAHTAHTGEYFAAKTYLIPKLNRMWQATGLDIGKFTEELKDSLFAKEMMNACLKRGAITLLLSNGEMISYDKAKDAVTYDWGMVSKDVGFKVGEFPAKEEPAAEEKPMSAFQKARAKAARTMETLTPGKPKEPKVDKGPVIGEKKTDTKMAKTIPSALSDSTALIKDDGFEEIPVPKDYASKTNKQKRDWILTVTDKVPEEYKKIKVLRVKKRAEGETYQSFKEAGREMKDKVVEEATAKAQASGKDVTVHHVGNTKIVHTHEKVPAEVATTTGLPLLQPDQKAKIRAFIDKGIITKVVDEHVQLIKDPAKLSKVMDTLPNFAKQMEGSLESMDEMLNWPYKAFVELGRSEAGVEALAVIICNLNADIRKLRGIDAGTAKTPAADATVVAPAAKALTGFAARRAAAQKERVAM